MGLDEEISTAIEAQLVLDSLTIAKVYNTKHQKPTKVPWIYVNTNGPGSRTRLNLNGTYYRKELPWKIEIQGSSDDDVDALENTVEKAIAGLSTSVTAGWYELTAGDKAENTKQYQKWIYGTKIYHKNISV